MTWLDSPLYALDTETTGTDPETSSLLTCCLGLSTGAGSWRPMEWLEAISDDDRGECDWGYCNRPAVAMRLDPEVGDWLSVCAWHVSHPAESVEVTP